MMNLDTMPFDTHNLDAITMVLNCSLFDGDTECGFGTPMEVTLKLVATMGIVGDGKVAAFYEYWWFWILTLLTLSILCCLLTLIRLIRRQKRLDLLLSDANDELQSKREENEERVVHVIKHSAAKSPNLTSNPLGTGVPDSMPLLDPIEQELNARQHDSDVVEHFVVPNDEIFDAFDYRVNMKPKEKVMGKGAKKSSSGSSSEMTVLDARGRKKTPGWKTSMAEPLLQS